MFITLGLMFSAMYLITASSKIDSPNSLDRKLHTQLGWATVVCLVIAVLTLEI